MKRRPIKLSEGYRLLRSVGCGPVTSGLAAFAWVVTFQEIDCSQPSPSAESKPARMRMACPWCDGPLRHVQADIYHGALCEDDDCGFASKGALLSPC